MSEQDERDVLELLEELANWNVTYSERKVKGQYQRQIAAQKLLAAIYFTSTAHVANPDAPAPALRADLPATYLL